MTFTEAKQKYNDLYKNKDLLEKSLVKSSGNDLENISIKDKHGNPSEEYFKWEFIYSLINSGLYSKEYIGVELSFPKGSAGSSNLRLDGVIFDSKDWVEKYNNKDKVENLEWLRSHILAVIEFKKSKREEVKKVYSSQLKPAMNEANKSVLGFNYMETSKLKFIRTKCLQSHSILLNMDEAIGINPASFKNFNLSKGDILVVKDSNIGEVCYIDEDLPHCSISGGIVKINLTGELDKFYILGVMKSSFFKEQIDLMTPKGATIRHSKDTYKYAKIPIPHKSIIKKISMLTKSYILKERLLRNKFYSINKIISDELEQNQKPKKFQSKLLTFDDLIKNNRFDTGLYTENFKKIEHFIKNYKNGSDTITNFGFYSVRGQNLAVSVIGKSIYSDKEKHNFYKLFLPTHITKYGTISKVIYFGNSRNLIEVKNGDIIFGAEGFEKGRSHILTHQIGKLTTNYHGTILRSENKKGYESIFLKCMLDWYREKGIIDAIAVGGNGGSFSTKYWKFLHIPKFEDNKQKEIAKLYSNHNDTYINHISNFDIEKFEEIDKKVNKDSGILDLDLQIKTIKEIINNEIRRMIS